MTSTNGNGGTGAAVRDPELDRARLRAVHAALTSGDIATAGKLADYVVLADDPHTIDVEKIKDIQIVRTVVGGTISHQA